MNTAIRLPIVCEAVAATRAVPSLWDDVARGLFSTPRHLPAKYFYDERGSQLFDQICNVPEYYPTRTENALLAEVAGDIIARAMPASIIELGSGMSRKTHHLLEACARQDCYASYAPFDVCDEVLLLAGERLMHEFPWLTVQPLSGDYSAGLARLPRRSERNLVAFLGGTIGNFSASESHAFLSELRAFMGPDDRLLLGADRVKRPEALHAAYNDFAGVTAEFNRNVLRVINHELGADFDLERYAHYAYFNPLESQIEMHLVAMAPQRVKFAVNDAVLELREGDTIRTEISRKFTRSSLEAMVCDAGFAVERHYESRAPAFSLVLARPV
ncbi:MAG: L-histidine N(alpha)-methyltransferase [Gammaproteobacteria bacterium]|nr:L-histidine N(alpha)-methyltransferase [Gammaproteobacteria bacterium]